MSKEEDVSEEFLGQLKDVVGSSDRGTPANRHSAKHNMVIRQNKDQDIDMTMTTAAFGGAEMDIDSPIAVPAADHLKDAINLDELCADLMNMHGDGHTSLVQKRGNIDTDYEFAWTGM